MNKILRNIVSAFFPERCPYCGDVINAGKPACPECVEQFPETIREGHAIGGYPYTAPFAYNGIFAEAVKRFKFNGHKEYAEKLAWQITNAVKESFSDAKFDCITCVPMHKNQLKNRGYNQSELLAKNIAKQLNIPYETLLVKHKENQPQHSLTSSQKRDNVKGVYKALNTDKIKGNNILVIDDILTTGHTLGECCRILSKAGGEKIYCAALCAKIIR